jgi:hypothetical protein
MKNSKKSISSLCKLRDMQKSEKDTEINTFINLDPSVAKPRFLKSNHKASSFKILKSEKALRNLRVKIKKKELRKETRFRNCRYKRRPH